jgi:hypothetical protein
MIPHAALYGIDLYELLIDAIIDVMNHADWIFFAVDILGLWMNSTTMPFPSKLFLVMR